MADPWTQAMRRGDWAAARQIERAVLAGRDLATRDDPRLPYHLRWVWAGTPPDGRRVLVRCYHGLGDTLQFSRFLPLLRARAAHVTVECQPALLPLLALLPGHNRLLPFDPAHPVSAAEVDVEIMELPHMLDVLHPPPPLRPDLPPSARTKATGLCWQAGDWDPRRSVRLETLLAEVPGPLVSLQRGPAAAEATDARFVNPQDDDPDVLRTAALIVGARRVVTVDTMVAHLAGLLGAPTEVLLHEDADWRWGTGESTPWYPSLRLLRR